MNEISPRELSGGPVLVNGEAPGDVWRTENASGVWEVMHGWGNKEIVSALGAWVQRDGDTLTVGPLFEQPTVMGEQRSGYFSPRLSGTLDREFPPYIQHFAARERLTTADGDVWRVRFATIVSNEESAAPVALCCAQEEFNGAEFSRISFQAMF